MSSVNRCFPAETPAEVRRIYSAGTRRAVRCIIEDDPRLRTKQAGHFQGRSCSSTESRFRTRLFTIFPVEVISAHVCLTVSVPVATLIIVSKVTPQGRATRILLTISALGIFRVVKTITLILVKCLIHSYLHVALQHRLCEWRAGASLTG